jgi:hypothetical protein
MKRTVAERREEAEERQAARDKRGDAKQLAKVEKINPDCREAKRLRERLGEAEV